MARLMIEATHGLDLIDRTLRTTGLLLLVFALFGLFYLGFYPTLGIATATIWSLVNLMFLARLVRAAIRPDDVDKLGVAGLALVKFPLLYVSGYFLLNVTVFEIWHLLVGFSVPMAVLVFKVVARSLFGLHNGSNKNGNPQEAG